MCYVNGLGVSQDLESAAQWLQRSADQGHAGAQFHLGTWDDKRY